jgi:hypothetical protein
MKTSVSVESVEYVPFEAGRYPLVDAISTAQRAAIRTMRQRTDWAHLSEHGAMLFQPLLDNTRRSGTSQVFIVRAIFHLSKHVYHSQRPYWQCSEARWLA